jgi:hypothetical protein
MNNTNNDIQVKVLKGHVKPKRKKIREYVSTHQKKKSFAETLISIPNVGNDLDFKREQ